MLLAGLYGYETWSFRRYMVGKMALKRIYGSGRREIIGVWRMLHDELHNLDRSPNITTVIK
jgi:hypothetical protein